MIRRYPVLLILAMFALPALAKDADLYPVSCDALWTAVKATLNNPSDYSVIEINDFAHRAWFYVIGDLSMFKDAVSLSSRNNGCAIKLSITQIGSDNSDERGFRGRLKRALVKLQKPNPAGGVSTGVSTASTPAQPTAAPPPPKAPAKPQISPRVVAGAIWASTVISHPGTFSPAGPVQTTQVKPQPPAPVHPSGDSQGGS